MRRSRLAELKRARPIAWQNALRRAAVGGGCWRMSADARALVQNLERIFGETPESAARFAEWRQQMQQVRRERGTQ